MSKHDAFRSVRDRQEITDLIHRYCRAVDRIDEELGKSVFHSHATADYGDFYQGSGHGAITKICESHRACVTHSHNITTVSIVLDDDRAASEAYHIAAIRTMSGDKLVQVTVWGRYLDTWSRCEGRWGIDHRRVLRDLDETREVQTMSYGAPRRDLACPSYATLEFAGGVNEP